MAHMSSLRFCFCLLLAAVSLAAMPQTQSVPPALLQIYRDPVKPSRMAEYSRIESEAALACARARSGPYLGAQTMTSPQEDWVISGFDSYEAMEHSAEPVARNAALTAELNRLLEAKANLVEQPREVFAHYRDDLSGNAPLIQPRTRFFTVTIVTVHPGHERDFEEIHRALRAARQRTGTVDNRVVYQIASGMPRNTYLIFSAHRSLQNAGAALDPTVDEYAVDVDDSTRNRLDEYTRVSVQSSETWLFSVSPAMSNPAGEWIADDPQFWHSSPVLQRPSVAKKPAESSAR